MLNLRFTKSKILALYLLSTSLWGASRDLEQQMHKISLHVEEMEYQLNHHKVEIDLFHERLNSLEEGVREGLQSLTKMQGKQLEVPKIHILEEGQKALLADLKTLKNELVACVSKQKELEKSVQGQLKEVQQNLHKALQILGGESADRHYVVKTGDSLGLIAQRNKVSVKALREANKLTGDQIYVGQKLCLP